MKASKTVLIVEDEPPIVRFLRPALEGEGFRVVEASRGGQALELAAKFKPDVVLLDLGLPDMDGLDVLKGLRRWTSAAVIVPDCLVSRNFSAAFRCRSSSSTHCPRMRTSGTLSRASSASSAGESTSSPTARS